jgi:hypothetical protein
VSIEAQLALLIAAWLAIVIGGYKAAKWINARQKRDDREVD